jgi:hypothetical protein
VTKPEILTDTRVGGTLEGGRITLGTLKETITSGAATAELTASPGAEFEAGTFSIQIDNELIRVSVAGAVLTLITRGYAGTTAAEHKAPTGVFNVLSAPGMTAWLNNLMGGNVFVANGEDQTTALKEAIEATPEGTTLWLAPSPTGQPIKVKETVKVEKPMTVRGSGMSPFYGPLQAKAKDPYISQETPQAPYLQGSVIEQTGKNQNGIEAKNDGGCINFYDLGIKFASPFKETGHGFVAVNKSEVEGENKLQYQQHAPQGMTWCNLAVFGHDGSHYGFNLTNSQLNAFTQLQSWGGGCLFWNTSEWLGSGWANQSNSTINQIYGFFCCHGTAHGIDLSPSSTEGLNGMVMLRPQINMEKFPKTYEELFGANEGPNTAVQYAYRDHGVGTVYLMIGADMESTLAGAKIEGGNTMWLVHFIGGTLAEAGASTLGGTLEVEKFIVSTGTFKSATPASSAVSTGQSAESFFHNEGGEGGQTTITTTGTGGKGASLGLTMGKGAEAPNAKTKSVGGEGGGSAFTGGAGAPSNVEGGANNKGGQGGKVQFLGGTGGVSTTGTVSTGGTGGEINLKGGPGAEGATVAGAGGKIEGVAGLGAKGHAGSFAGGEGGKIFFKAGNAGAVGEAGKEGKGGNFEATAGTSTGTAKGGSIIFKTGLGTAEGTGGEFLVETGKTSLTKKLQITETALGFFGATAQEQKAEIKEPAAFAAGASGFTSEAAAKELWETVQKLVKVVAANAGGFGLSK